MLLRSSSLAVPLLLVALFWLGKAFTERRVASYQRPVPIVNLQTAQFYSRSMRKFSLGYDNLIADFLWVQLLQNASHERQVSEGVSWEYAKVKGLTTLDPRFSRAYWLGAAFVSVFRRDKAGAKDILENWAKAYPTLWQPHYYLGMHLFHEMGDNVGGAGSLVRAAGMVGAPGYLASLGVRLFSEAGAYFSSLQAAVELYESFHEPEGKARLLGRIRSLNFALQKMQWTEAVGRYRRAHGRTPASLGQVSLDPQASPSQFVQGLSASEETRRILQERFKFEIDPTTKEVASLLANEDRWLETVGIFRPHWEE